MAVITINGQIGSAVELGRELASRLGYAYVDRQVLVETSRRTGASEAVLAAQESRRWTAGQRLRSRLESAFSRGGAGLALNDPMLAGWWDFMGVPYPRLDTALDSVPARSYLQVVSAVIRDMADEGNAVIVGRASNIILKGWPASLHVRTVAPAGVRAETIMRRERLDRAQAERFVQEQEAARVSYYQRLFKADEADSLLYDMVLNIGALGVLRAAGIVQTALPAGAGS